MEPGYITQVNGIGGLTKPQVIGHIVLELEYKTGKIHKLTFENVYYFPEAPKLLVGPQTWARDRDEVNFGLEGTYLKVMGKNYVLVWNNRTYHRNILHDPGCALLYMSINQYQEVLSKLCIVLVIG